MSTSAQRNLTSHDLVRVGFIGLAFASQTEDSKQWPPHLEAQMRDARIRELQAKEESLKNPVVFAPRNLPPAEANELKQLLATQAADQTTTQTVTLGTAGRI